MERERGWSVRASRVERELFPSAEGGGDGDLHATRESLPGTAARMGRWGEIDDGDDVKATLMVDRVFDEMQCWGGRPAAAARGREGDMSMRPAHLTGKHRDALSRARWRGGLARRGCAPQGHERLA
jgi:hypothetical protein